MTWESARAALDAHLLTLAGIDPAKVSWPGIPFTSPATGPWYRADFLPASVVPELAGADHEVGIYQVTVMDLPGTGIGALTRAADSVVALFSRKRLGNTSCGVPFPGPVIPDGAWNSMPVSIPFQNL